MKSVTFFLVGILLFTTKGYTQSAEITIESLTCIGRSVWVAEAVDFGQGIVKLNKDSLAEKKIGAEMVEKLCHIHIPSWYFRDDKSCGVNIFDYHNTSFNEYSLQKGKKHGQYILVLREMVLWLEKGEFKEKEISKLKVDCFMWNGFLAIKAPKNHELGEITVYYNKLIVK